MIWTDRHGHEWDLETRSACRRCGQKKPHRFDSTCPRKRREPESAEAENQFTRFTNNSRP